MIRFLREKQGMIVWGIIIFFVATMFTGSFFMSDHFNSNTSETESPKESDVAWVGSTPLDPLLFNRNIQAIFRSVTTRMDPEAQESLIYQAFTETVKQMIFLNMAKEKDIEVSRSEREAGIEQYVMLENVRDKEALKEKYKKNNYDYDKLIDIINQQILMEKAKRELLKDVTVTNEDVDNFYTEVDVQHILIKVSPTDKASEKEKVATQIYKELQSKKLNFEAAVAKYSEDTPTLEKKGSLGKIRLGQTLPEFDAAVFSLKPGEISKPIKTLFGYHIVKLNSKQELKRPIDFDYEKEKPKLLEFRQTRTLELAIVNALQFNPIKINDPILAAADAKAKGNWASAEANYQLQISKRAYDPVANFMLGNLYVKAGEVDKGIAEYEKAKVKIALVENKEFPDLFIAWGKACKSKGDTGLALELYKTALTQSLKVESLLLILKEEFTSLKAGKELATVTQALAQIQVEKDAAQQAAGQQ